MADTEARLLVLGLLSAKGNSIVKPIHALSSVGLSETSRAKILWCRPRAGLLGPRPHCLPRRRSHHPSLRIRHPHRDRQSGRPQSRRRSQQSHRLNARSVMAVDGLICDSSVYGWRGARTLGVGRETTMPPDDRFPVPVESEELRLLKQQMTKWAIARRGHNLGECVTPHSVTGPQGPQGEATGTGPLINATARGCG